MDGTARFRDSACGHTALANSRPHRRGNSRLRPHDKDGGQNGHGMLRVHAMNARRLWSTRTHPKTRPHRLRSTWSSVQHQRTARKPLQPDVSAAVDEVEASKQDEKGPETGQGDTSEEKTGQSHPEIKHDASLQDVQRCRNCGGNSTRHTSA